MQTSSNPFSNFPKILWKVKQLLWSRSGAKQDGSTPWLGVADKSPKKSSSKLLDLASDSERYSSEEDQLIDSDMDQRDYFKEEKSKRSDSSKEESTLNITPSHLKVFFPSKEQKIV